MGPVLPPWTLLSELFPTIQVNNNLLFNKEHPNIFKHPSSIKWLFELDSIVSQQLVIIGFNNGLSPVWRQTVTCTNGNLLSVGPSEIKSGEIWMKNAILFVLENASENIVGKAYAIW